MPKNKTQKVKKMQRKSKTKNNTIQQLGLKKQSNPKIPPPKKKKQSIIFKRKNKHKNK